MKTKIYAVALMIVLSTILSFTTFAANTQPMPNDSITVWGDRSKKNKPTDEQNVEMKAKHKAMEAKWNSLSKEQKQQIYVIQNKLWDAKIEMINKYLELGLIDKETADYMKEKMTTRKAEMQNDGNMPMFGHRGNGLR